MSDELVCGWPRVRIPETCRNVEIVIGIDEAGRGPVLGSLVYTAAFWPASENDAIAKLGFDDSKQLKEDERDKLFDQIKSHPSIGWVIEEITAQDISKVIDIFGVNDSVTRAKLTAHDSLMSITTGDAAS
jgi:ribonuclease HII